VQAAGQPLNLFPGSRQVGGAHWRPALLFSKPQRLITDLIDQPGYTIGQGEDSSITVCREVTAPLETGSPHLSAEVAAGLFIIKRLKIAPDGNPLGDPLKFRLAQHLL